MIQQMRVLKSTAVLLMVSAFLISCGQGTVLEPLPQTTKKAPTKTTSSSSSSSDLTSQLQQTPLTNVQQGTTSNQTASTDSAACVATRKKMTDLYSACGGIIQQYQADLGGCYSSLSNLTQTTSCTGIDSRLGAFTSACSSYLTQYQNYLPSSCSAAVNAAKN